MLFHRYPESLEGAIIINDNNNSTKANQSIEVERKKMLVSKHSSGFGIYHLPDDIVMIGP